MIKLICDCGKKFEAEKFEKGATRCPRCGFASFLKEDVNEFKKSTPDQLEKKETPVGVCVRCGVYWTNLLQNTFDGCCPKCSGKDWHVEFLFI